MVLRRAINLICVTLLCSLVIGCNDDNSEEAGSSSDAELVSDNSENGEVAIDENDVNGKIDKAIQNANKTYADLAAFRERVFDDGLEQGVAILCSINRVIKLNGNNIIHDNFTNKVSTVLKKQKFISIDHSRYKYEYIENNKDTERMVVYTPEYIYYDRRVEINNFIPRIMIPSSLPYKKPDSDNKERVFYSKNNEIYTLPENTSSDEYIGFDFKVKQVQICAEHYVRPIPVNEEARKKEKMTFGFEIMGAIDRLNNYTAKLAVIESKAADVQSMEATLRKLKHDYSFDLIDPLYANTQISDYHKMLNSAIQSIDVAKSELRVKPTFNEEAIKQLTDLLAE